MKIVIAFTGARTNILEANAARKYCDNFIKKDADMTEWIKLLDKYTDVVTDPFEMWTKARIVLFEKGADIKQVLELEDAYVRSIKQKSKDFFSVWQVVNKIPSNGNIKGVIQSLVASAIYGILMA